MRTQASPNRFHVGTMWNKEEQDWIKITQAGKPGQDLSPGSSLKFDYSLNTAASHHGSGTMQAPSPISGTSASTKPCDLLLMKFTPPPKKGKTKTNFHARKS